MWLLRKSSERYSVSKELVICQEMLDAGIEQLDECRDRGLSEEQTVISVYLAMEGIREIKSMRVEGRVH